jgi:hypothetical protein
VENQGDTYQTEAEARRDECNQHSGRKSRKDNERSASGDTSRLHGYLGRVRVGQYFTLEHVVGNVDAHE